MYTGHMGAVEQGVRATCHIISTALFVLLKYFYVGVVMPSGKPHYKTHGDVN